MTFWDKNSIAVAMFVFTSCTTVTTSNRKGRDLRLDKSNGHHLNGTFSVINKDYIFNREIRSSPYLRDLPDSAQIRCRLELISVDRIKVIFYSGNSIYTQLMFRGKFKRGYFKLRRSWNAHMLVGPLVWGLGNHSVFLGVTNDKNLIALSATGGLGFIIAVPGFASGGQLFEIYNRVDR